jgi:nitroreductase
MTTQNRAADQIALLCGLRAVRDFLPDPIPEAVIADILAVVDASGSAFIPQPWELVLVRDRAMLAELAQTTQYARHLAGAALGIVLVLAGDPARVEHETYDEGRLSERIMLAAAAHDVGACVGWVRGPTEAAVKTMLGIPDGRRVRTLISFGYRDEASHAARPVRGGANRRPLSEIVHAERFGQLTPE